MPKTRHTAAPLLALTLLAGCTGIPDGITPVQGFEPKRYLGDWHEIMRLDHRFEHGLTQVSARYAARDDGSLSVANRGFDPEECAWQDADGSAVFQGARDVASLSVTFFWPFAGGYHVIALDREGYDWAMVAGPTRDYLWILARDAEMAPEIRADLVAQARELGFPVEELILVDHSPSACIPDA
jgi:apolipoprotein D and lipocalin family protein